MRVVFMGSPAFAERSLRALLDNDFNVVGVISQPDRPAGRGRKVVSPPVAHLAQQRGLPLMQPESPHEPAPLETLRAWAPDVIVVAAYGAILRPALLQLPPFGCVNVHASLLPRHRGACPINQVILDGDQVAGVTIMRMDEGMDTGPILSQQSMPIDATDTAGTLTAKLAGLGAELVVETLPAYLRGDIDPQPQDDSEATYTRMLCKADGRIDWKRPARDIWLRVRAFQPWPGTHTFWNGEMLKIIETRPAAWGPAGMPPGLVVDVDGEPAVTTGDGVLLLKRLQLAGKKPMDGIIFMRGQREFAGSVLDED